MTLSKRALIAINLAKSGTVPVDSETTALLIDAVRELASMPPDKRIGVETRTGPRQVLLQTVQLRKQQLAEEISAGHRDWFKLRLLLEDYIAFQTAADLLGGYEVKP